MDKIIKDTFIDTSGKRNRKSANVICPDCLTERTVRFDSLARNKTTCCRSCLNLRRETKATEDLFNWQDYYRSKEGRLAYIYQAQKARSKSKGWQKPSYTQQELIDWALAQEVYHSLYDTWVASNYLKHNSPSIDRIDDYGFYTLDNIQLMSWQANNDKGTHNQLIGLNTKNSVAVLQYDIKDNLIAEYFSMKEAERVTGISNASISRACKETNNSLAGGFKWKYK